MNSKELLSIAGISAVFLCAAPAKAGDGSIKTEDTERGYAYTFEDDPLDAAPQGDNGARISVRRGAKRTILIRPRTHFIVELFQSAEDL